jgi:hypothetical protein
MAPRARLCSVVLLVLVAFVWVGAGVAGAGSTAGTKSSLKQFQHCPLDSESVTDCIYSLSDHGSFSVGNKLLTISEPIIFQGGFGGAGAAIRVFGAKGSPTLLPRRQSIPGGLDGLRAPSWWPPALREFFDRDVSGKGGKKVTAIIELAGPAASIGLNTENLLLGHGIALRLPVKIHLESRLLGRNCYVGADSSPLMIPLTTEKSGPLHGSAGQLSFHDSDSLRTITGLRLVSDSFAAPAATGCGGIFSSLLDPLVNSAVGLPSPAGSNRAVLGGDLDDAAASLVRAAR